MANPGVIFAVIQETIDMPVMILLVINTGYLLRGGVEVIVGRKQREY